MLLLRGLIFTVLLPGTLAGFVPWLLRAGKVPQPGWWQSGWVVLIAGVALYLRCLASFLAANGTPALFILGPLSAIVGREPPSLVRGGLYRFSRNPMYVGVLAAVFGQAILFRSGRSRGLRHGVVAHVPRHGCGRRRASSSGQAGSRL
jgi:protein-S-isoprenylcysteine O-methyltransferase Ste14